MNRPVRFTVPYLEEYFLRQAGGYPENSDLVCDRWGRILYYVPSVRGRSLFDDLSDVYVDAERSAVGMRLLFVIDLLELQARFFWFLHLNNAMLTHVRDYRQADLRVWQRRLSDRAKTTKPYRINSRGNVARPIIPPVSATARWKH